MRLTSQNPELFPNGAKPEMEGPLPTRQPLGDEGWVPVELFAPEDKGNKYPGGKYVMERRFSGVRRGDEPMYHYRQPGWTPTVYPPSSPQPEGGQAISDEQTLAYPQPPTSQVPLAPTEQPLVGAPTSEAFLHSIGLGGDQPAQVLPPPSQQEPVIFGPGAGAVVGEEQEWGPQGAPAPLTGRPGQRPAGEVTGPNKFVRGGYETGIATDAEGMVRDGTIRAEDDPAQDVWYRERQRAKLGLTAAPEEQFPPHSEKPLAEKVEEGGALGAEPPHRTEKPAPDTRDDGEGDVDFSEEDILRRPRKRRSYEELPQLSGRAREAREPEVPRSVADRTANTDPRRKRPLEED